jgi:hypothetical protein
VASPGQDAVELVAEAGGELGEDLAQVVLDCARGEVQPGADLPGSGRRGSAARDLGLLPGNVALATAALEWLSERTRVTPTEWALGIEALVRALLTEDEAAESLYREAIERLGGTPRPRAARLRSPALRRVAAPRAPPC